MGTNYYLRLLPCERCGHALADLHVGKSSAGWNFALRIYPKVDDARDERLKSFGVEEICELDDWRPLFARFPIFDEYGHEVAVDAMLSQITKQAHPRGLKSHASIRSLDSARGERALPGEGTYDLCPYEFS